MADSPAPAESPAQAKARLRRERLAAKSGAGRLQKITALQGGPPKDIAEFEKDVPGTLCPPQACVALHPAGIAISRRIHR